MDEKVRWLLVGTGDIAKKRVAPALTSCAGSDLVGVCDIVRERAEKVADEFGAQRVFDTLQQGLADRDVDAVYLATPVWLHARQAAKVLQAGKHLLVEKPLASSHSDAAKAVAASEEAQANELKAACAYFRRFSPRYVHAKNMLANGEFGQVVLVRMTYFSWFNPAETDPKYWRVVKSKSGGGPLSDMGSHMFDLLIGLFGLPKRVYAQCENLVQKWDVEDSAAIIMTLANGAQVLASFNWNSKTWSHEFEIIGTEAKVKWHPSDSGKVIKTVGRDIQELDLPNPENVHTPLIEDFIEAVRTGRDPATSLAEAAKTNLLLDAVYRSSQTGKEIVL